MKGGLPSARTVKAGVEQTWGKGGKFGIPQWKNQGGRWGSVEAENEVQLAIEIWG